MADVMRKVKGGETTLQITVVRKKPGQDAQGEVMLTLL
jgi:hypothetical protein